LEPKRNRQGGAQWLRSVKSLLDRWEETRWVSVEGMRLDDWLEARFGEDEGE